MFQVVFPVLLSVNLAVTEVLDSKTGLLVVLVGLLPLDLPISKVSNPGSVHLAGTVFHYSMNLSVFGELSTLALENVVLQVLNFVGSSWVDEELKSVDKVLVHGLNHNSLLVLVQTTRVLHDFNHETMSSSI